MTERLAAIAGIYEYPARLAPETSPWQIKAVAAAEALADAGLAWSDVDALYDAGDTGGLSGMAIPEYLGLRPDVIDTTAVGGSSFEFHAAHAARAIAAGKAKVALLTYGSTSRSKRSILRNGVLRRRPADSAGQHGDPVGADIDRQLRDGSLPAHA